MYNEPTIVERVYAAKGDALACDMLARDYISFIEDEAANALQCEADQLRDDEMSIAMFAFHEAVETYERERGTFMGYAAHTIGRKLSEQERRQRWRRGFDLVEEEGAQAIQEAAKEEIVKLTAVLKEYGLNFSDVSDNCPKQERALEACRIALKYALDRTRLMEEIQQSKRLPLARICEGTGIERRVLERFDKYILAMILIYSSDCENIKRYLKMGQDPQREGRMERDSRERRDDRAPRSSVHEREGGRGE